jgi:sulfocyanin SoxE-like protein
MAPPPRPAQFLKVDARTHTASVTLIASYNGTNNGFNFDGYSRELMWKVPRGWTVRVLCENRGSLRHSCAVVANSLATKPAFPGASTRHPKVGLAPGKKARFSFRAAKAGTYRFACLVPGHEDARMWDVLKIVRRGKPSVVDLRSR